MLRFSAPPRLSAIPARGPQAVAITRPFASGRSDRGLSEQDLQDLQAARAWLDKLHADTIPKGIGELSFSRSSGPGGQNVNKSNALIIQADDSRKQNDNAHSCYKRLYEAIVDAGRNALPGETSAEQAQRVKNLQKSDNERRLKSKKQHSTKKNSRRSRGDD